MLIQCVEKSMDWIMVAFDPHFRSTTLCQGLVYLPRAVGGAPFITTHWACHVMSAQIDYITSHSSSQDTRFGTESGHTSLVSFGGLSWKSNRKQPITSIEGRFLMSAPVCALDVYF